MNLSRSTKGGLFNENPYHLLDCFIAFAFSQLGVRRLNHRNFGPDDPAKMSPFFTDAGMKTMRSGDEFKKAWMAMSEEDRTSIKKDCGDDAIAKQHDNFCKMTKELGGAN